MVSVKINVMCPLEWATGAQVKHCFWEFLDENLHFNQQTGQGTLPSGVGHHLIPREPEGKPTVKERIIFFLFLHHRWSWDISSQLPCAWTEIHVVGRPGSQAL